MTDSGDQRTAADGGRGRLRASRADREQAIELLKAAFVQDRLDKDELDTRVGQALASRTYAELAAVSADIPAALPSAARPARRRVRSSQYKGYKAAAGAFAALSVCLLAGLEIASSDGNPVEALVGWAVFTAFCALMLGAPCTGRCLAGRPRRHGRTILAADRCRSGRGARRGTGRRRAWPNHADPADGHNTAQRRREDTPAGRANPRRAAVCLARPVARRGPHVLHCRRDPASDRPAGTVQAQRAAPAPDRRPELAAPNGPAGRPESGAAFYSGEDLAALVAYAADRFVTVVPEVDTPGHASALLQLHPELNSGRLFPNAREG